MTRDTPMSLKFPPRHSGADYPDVGFAALPLFRRLRDALAQTARERPPRWGVPKLFFFNDALQTEWEQLHGKHRPWPTCRCAT